MDCGDSSFSQSLLRRPQAMAARDALGDSALPAVADRRAPVRGEQPLEFAAALLLGLSSAAQQAALTPVSLLPVSLDDV